MCSLEGLMLKLKLQCFGHLMQRADSFKKTLMLGKIEGRRRGQPRMRWLAGTTNSMDMGVWVDSGSWWWIGRPGVLWFIGSQRVGHDWASKLNWTECARCCSQRFLILLITLWKKHYYHLLMIRKMRLREVKYIAQGHTARKQQNWSWDTGSPEPTYLITSSPIVPL